jgi:hypothetical protein
MAIYRETIGWLTRDFCQTPASGRPGYVFQSQGMREISEERTTCAWEIFCRTSLQLALQLGDRDIFMSSGRKWRLADEEKDTAGWMDGWMSTSPARSTAFFESFPSTGVEQLDQVGGRSSTSTSRSTATCLFRIDRRLDRRRECSIGIRLRFDAPPVSTREARRDGDGSRDPGHRVRTCRGKG